MLILHIAIIEHSILPVYYVSDKDVLFVVVPDTTSKMSVVMVQSRNREKDNDIP